MTDEHPVYRITDIEKGERPRERLARVGAENIGTAELLAILLRTGLPGENAIAVGQRLLNTFGGIPGIHRASYQELRNQKGIGPAKAAQIKAAVELGRRMAKEKPEERKAISRPEDAADMVLYEMSYLDKEELRVLLLDTKNRVINIVKEYMGSVNSSQVRIAEVFKEAISHNATSIIVVHNHPSGDPSASPEDIAITKAFIEAGDLLDIQVLDHIIIGGGNFISMKRAGLAFDR